jgi:hypothetical protein
MLLYAPAPVIKAWIAWGRVPIAEDPDEFRSDLFVAMEDLLRAIRSDLGHKEGDLKVGDLQRIYAPEVATEVWGPFQP